MRWLGQKNMELLASFLAPCSEDSDTFSFWTLFLSVSYAFPAFSFLLFFYPHNCTSGTTRSFRWRPQLLFQPSNCLLRQTMELPEQPSGLSFFALWPPFQHTAYALSLWPFLFSSAPWVSFLLFSPMFQLEWKYFLDGPNNSTPLSFTHQTLLLAQCCHFSRAVLSHLLL